MEQALTQPEAYSIFAVAGFLMAIAFGRGNLALWLGLVLVCVDLIELSMVSILAGVAWHSRFPAQPPTNLLPVLRSLRVYNEAEPNRVLYFQMCVLIGAYALCGLTMLATKRGLS